MRLLDEPSTSITDPYLARAYSLAELGRGNTHPNPVVGCVIVRDDDIVGEGFHHRAGEPHAEVLALEAAGSWARGGTAYVTLEPCNHQGMTPPCTRALLDAGVDRVVIGAPDPNPGVAGGGANALRADGMDVEFSGVPEVFESLNTDWNTWVTSGRPWVTLKTALTLDGRAAYSPATRTRVSGPEARELTMALRHRATGVAVGARTALVDAPHLNLEPPFDSDAQPRRIVISQGTDIDPMKLAASLSHTTEPWTVLGPSSSPEPFAAESGSQNERIEYVGYDSSMGLRGALETLGSLGIVHLLVEAGPGLFTAFWKADLVDELVLYHSGGVFGSSAPSTYADTTDVTSDVLDRRLAVVETGIVGVDAVTVWRRRRAGTV